MTIAFKRRSSVALAMLCSVFAAFATVWIVVPAPAYQLWLEAVAASEWSLWLGASAHQCIPFTELNGKRFPIVDETECVGCNLCALVCPVPGCISMVRLDDGHAPLTWREMSNKQPETMTGN